jgi:hypothetical protein
VKDTTPPRTRKAWRRPAGEALPLKQVCSEISRLVARRPDQQPLLELATFLAHSAAASELYSLYTFSGWIITDAPELHFNDNILFVRYYSDKHEFEFEHRTLADHNDVQRCPEVDA